MTNDDTSSEVSSSSSPNSSVKRWSSSNSILLIKLYILFEVLSFVILLCIGTTKAVSSRDSISEVSANQQQRQELQTERVLDIKEQYNNTALHELPSLSSLLNPSHTKVIGDISFLLDFAIIGFPKSGTTFLKDYINQTSQTHVHERELCIKKYSDLIDFVELYYDLHEQYNSKQQHQHQQEQGGYPSMKDTSPSRIKFGLKCPGVLYRNDLSIYKRYFPTTKLIIGLRSPLSWFESFYNYQMTKSKPSIQKDTNTTNLIGMCKKHQKVCTHRARFHSALGRLGKTSGSSDDELNLLFGRQQSSEVVEDSSMSTAISNENVGSSSSRRLQQQEEQHNGIPNQVLLYELNQIHNPNTSQYFTQAIQDYLDIAEESLPKISSYHQYKPRTIDICNEEHEEVRKVLLDIGIESSTWIQDYLMKSPSVNVVDSDSFGYLLDDWKVDSCLNKTKTIR